MLNIGSSYERNDHLYATDTTAPFNYQTTATYSCNAGYEMSVGDTVRTCSGSLEGDGYWTGTALICIIIEVSIYLI